MLTDLTIGQYFPGNSVVHRLDPRSKIMLLIVLIAAVFMVKQPLSYVLFCAFTLCGGVISEIPARMLLKSIRPLWWIIIFTFLIHIFTTHGEVLWAYSFLSITKEGLIQAATVSLRLILLILWASLLTLTTSPIALTDALEKLLSPLAKLGVPAHEIAMMMTIALRFIPTLLEETDRIMKAQEARGANFRSGGIAKRVRNMIPLLVPLFIGAFRRADDLAVAMEARCYRGGENRTRMRILKIGMLDYKAYVLAVFFFVVVFMI